MSNYIITESMKEKALIRSLCLGKRMSLSAPQVQINSEKIVKNLITYINWRKIKTINVFQTIKINKEIDISILLDFLKTKYPAIKIDITSSKVSAVKDVSEGKSYDLVIVPLLGFDRSGNRLGYGGGYYDKFLSRNNCKEAIGLGYSLQEVKSLPVEEHDQKLDLIITEKEIIKS